jgi:hypothetical protein
MKITGKVTNKTENAEGHSQVRISAEVVLGKAGAEATQPERAEIIVSTPSASVVAAFKVGQTVSFEL